MKLKLIKLKLVNGKHVRTLERKGTLKDLQQWAKDLELEWVVTKNKYGGYWRTRTAISMFEINDPLYRG